MWPDSFVSFDTETTGFGSTARIIELALVLFEAGKPVDEWTSLLRPDGVDWEDEKVQKALAVNNITVDDLKDVPSFTDVLDTVASYFGGADVWVAHNTVFDLRMLNQEHAFHRGVPFPVQPRFSLCTQRLSAKAHPHEKCHKLQEVAKRWGVEQEHQHRAISDALTCGRILSAMLSSKVVPVTAEELMIFQQPKSVSRIGMRFR